MKLTLEQRIARAERVLKMFVRKGRKYRTDFREKIEILIAMQMKDNAEWRARKREIDERINILINAHIATDEQMKKAADQMKRTDEQLKDTDRRIEALNAKIYESLGRLERNEGSSD